MIFWIVLAVVFFALFIWVVIADGEVDVGCFPFCAFIIALIVIVACTANARRNKRLYSDMAENPQCYSVYDLRNAHRDILYHKVHQGSWTSFYNGYEFPEININAMDEVNTTIHIVK